MGGLLACHRRCIVSEASPVPTMGFLTRTFARSASSAWLSVETTFDAGEDEDEEEAINPRCRVRSRFHWNCSGGVRLHFC